MPIISLLASARSRLLSSTSISIYAANGFTPELHADFIEQSYKGEDANSLTTLITHNDATAGNATMVDSDGLLKWRPHNLLPYSEDFSNAAWTKSNVTVVATSATLAPNGTTTAYKLIENSGVSSGRLLEATYPDQPSTFAVFAKAAEWGFVQLGVYNGASYDAVYVDLSDGSIVRDTTDGASVTSVGNGWYLVSAPYADFNVAATICGGDTSTRTLNTGDGTLSGAGDGTSGIYIWGAHLYRSDLGGMVNNPDRGDSYVPTTSSARYLPRIGHHVYNGSQWVNEGLLHESEARTNLVTYSEDFTDASWTKTSLTPTLDSVGPDGLTNSATTLTASGSTAYIYASATTVSAAASASAFVKAGTSSVVWLYWKSSASDGVAYFDLADQTTQAVAGTNQTPTNLIVEPFGDFYRVSATWAVGAETANFGIGIANAKGSLTVTSGKALIAFGAQLEAASTPSSYIPTSGSTVARAAETLTIEHENLPWPSPVVIGDELVTNGTFDTDVSGWSGARSNETLSVVSGRLRSTAVASGAHGAVATLSGLTIGKVYRVQGEVFVDGGVDVVYFRVVVASDLNQTSPVNQSSSSNATYDIAFVATATTMYVGGINVATNAGDYFELDNISVKEINPLSVSIAMDGRMTYADTGTAPEVIFVDWNSTDDIILRMDTNGSYTGRVFFRQYDGSSVDSVANDTYTPDILVPFSIASRHGSTFVNGAVDGVALTANTTPTALPDLETTDLSLGYDFMGTISLFRIWANDIADAGIVEASEPSTEPTLSLSFDGTENSFTVLDWSE